MDAVYPAGPTTVPADLTEPTSKYRNRAWLATGGLIAFTLLYFALSGWFAWTAWRLFSAGLNGQIDTLWGWAAAFGATFLAVFMIKALFFVQHRYAIDAVEIKRDEQPQLFEFLQRLADDAGAPRAHRVFVSGRVNAAVFYDLSLLNLIVPSKKNLEIGLALVNALTLGELKAVLAHEFGHFAQRSMAVGRWVYIAQQIAGQIISRRDALDGFLSGLSRFDVRIAWVGWVLSLIVWSIRSLTETAFRVVLIAQRALSREMEFQADLVAVSLTGSDALIHALHKIGFAEYAWDRAVGFAAGEAQAGRRVQDVFALQTFVTQRMRDVLGDPAYGAVAEVPRSKPETHRVFKQQLAQAPRMWSTHPSNNEREENAKRTYVAASIDDRTAWDVFANATALRERLSAELFRTPEQVKTVPLEESQKRLHEQYQRTYLDPQYRGAYLGRSIVRHATRAEELYDAAAGAAHLSALYPGPLADELALLRDIELERGALHALRDGFMEAPGGVIQHRGKELKRRDLPKAIEALEAELAAVQARVRAHDRVCRGAHLALAKSVGAGWSDYLSGLLAIVHYTDHTEADLLDAHGAFRNVLSIVTADGRVSNRELKRLLASCQQLWTPLQRIYEQAAEVTLDKCVRERLAIESWKGAIGELKLVRPGTENIGDWLGAVDSWVGHTAASLSALRLAALDELLLAERFL
ncbi:MAG TPA: M48 family metallopeptidase, partial [Gammaproteobacteria bacterium]|nr:M48 family metallopeptidase [Gammaproteobacteria bacterium]